MFCRLAILLILLSPALAFAQTSDFAQQNQEPQTTEEFLPWLQDQPEKIDVPQAEERVGGILQPDGFEQDNSIDTAEDISEEVETIIEPEMVDVPTLGRFAVGEGIVFDDAVFDKAKQDDSVRFTIKSYDNAGDSDEALTASLAEATRARNALIRKGIQAVRIDTFTMANRFPESDLGKENYTEIAIDPPVQVEVYPE